MKKQDGHQKIKCSVSNCSYNCKPESICTLNEISVCNCSIDKTTDSLKDTACASYKYDDKLK